MITFHGGRIVKELSRRTAGLIPKGNEIPVLAAVFKGFVDCPMTQPVTSKEFTYQIAPKVGSPSAIVGNDAASGN